MKYFIDTEFLEGKQTKRFLGFNVGQTKPTIDLISIGIDCENGRSYYAISKEFNVKEAWNRFQIVSDPLTQNKKEYWIRNNILKSIYKELFQFHVNYTNNGVHPHFGNAIHKNIEYNFNLKNLKWLIKKYGKTNHQIAKEIRNFVMAEKIDVGGQMVLGDFYPNENPDPQFYGYYCDYDWVVFCWLFGKMINLPSGFPYYCRDVKQILDETIQSLDWYYHRDILNERDVEKDRPATFKEKMDCLKTLVDFPINSNEHNALADARWINRLHNFIGNLENENLS